MDGAEGGQAALPPAPLRELRNRNATQIGHRPRPALASSARGLAKHEHRLQSERAANEAFTLANEALSKIFSRRSNGSSPSGTQSQDSDAAMEANITPQSQSRKRSLSPGPLDTQPSIKSARMASPSSSQLQLTNNCDLVAEAEEEDDSHYWDEDEELDWDSVEDPIAPVTTKPPSGSPEGLFHWANKKTVTQANDQAGDVGARKKAMMRAMQFLFNDDEDDSVHLPLPEVVQSSSMINSTPARPSTSKMPPLPSSTQKSFRTSSQLRPSAINTPVKNFKSNKAFKSFSESRPDSPYRSPFKSGRPQVKPVFTPVVQKLSNMPATKDPVFVGSTEPGSRLSLAALASLESWNWRRSKESNDKDFDDIVKILEDPASARRYIFNGPGEGGVEEARVAVASVVRCDPSQIAVDWVRNHYGLILWKLAGLAFHSSTQLERFTYAEVVRQLLFRYEVEINRFRRSAIKRIQERDSSAASPMTLSVYDIAHVEDDSDPLITLTDGWYRIDARIDAPICKAVLKGKIRLGCKLSILSATVDAECEPQEPIRAFLTSRLTINGNACKLAKWDAKLGFCRQAFASTLRSLTADGGLVPMMDVAVLRKYPKGYLEDQKSDIAMSGSFLMGSPQADTSRATTAFQAPWSEQEEEEKQQAWNRMRETAVEGIEQKMSDRRNKLNEIIELIETECEKVNADQFVDTGNGPDFNGHLEAMLSAESPHIYLRPARVLPALLSFARSRLESMDQSNQEEMERLVAKQCPPRLVRSFQIIRVCDWATASERGLPETSIHGQSVPSEKMKRCKRDALIRVWDAAKYDDDADYMRVGHRYQLYNLSPYKVRSWPRSIDDQDDVHLTTRSDTRWREVSSTS